MRSVGDFPKLTAHKGFLPAVKNKSCSTVNRLILGEQNNLQKILLKHHRMGVEGAHYDRLLTHPCHSCVNPYAGGGLFGQYKYCITGILYRHLIFAIFVIPKIAQK